MTPTTLPPIPWIPLPITPLPEVTEDNSEFVWRLFDQAVREMDKKRKEGAEA